MSCVDGLIPAHAGKTVRGAKRGVLPWAHPRSRGENPGRDIVPVIFAGSSPLTRGKPHAAMGIVDRLRLIPAHAGKTWSRLGGSNGRWAHPRSRGENSRCVTALTDAMGSSPLTRGKLIEDGFEVVADGLIPAHAGKTRSARSPSSLTVGSSPLTRGKRARSIRVRRILGLIPAHAGKTVAPRVIGVRRRAHPRSRGENIPRSCQGSPAGGSSPLTRGKQAAHHRLQNDLGLIPAHAGKTRRGGLHLRGAGAHPRSRGENDVKTGSGLPVLGSSPLTRGKHDEAARARERPGLIPAHAGKTDSPRCGVGAGWAHPRSRGENVRVGDGYGRSSGSSPLTRGKRRGPQNG